MTSAQVASSDPFFIVGFQRSGTTMLRLMLNAHPAIAIPHDSAELWLNYRGRTPSYGDLAARGNVERMMQDLLAEPRIKAWKTDLPRIRSSPNLCLTRSRASCDGFMRCSPGPTVSNSGRQEHWHLVELDKLNEMFPACKIIHIVRDRRDYALSHTGKDYIYGYATIWRAAVEWRDQVTLCKKMGAMLPRERFLELRYEDLILDCTRELHRVCKFLNVDFAPEMLRFYETVDAAVPAERRSLWPMLDKPPQASNVYKWKVEMSESDRAVFERNAGALLGEYGYESLPGPIRRGRLKEIWLQIYDRVAWRLARQSR
jgi:hypothetical protein